MLPKGIRNRGFASSVLLLLLSLGVIALTSGRPLLRTGLPGSWGLFAGLESISSLVAVMSGISCLAYSFHFNKQYYLIISLGFFILGAEGFFQGSLLTYLADLRGTIDYSRYVPFTHTVGKTVFAVFLASAFFHESIMSAKDRRDGLTVVWTLAALLLGIGIVAFALSIPLPRMIFPERVLSRPFDLIPALLFLCMLTLSLIRHLRSEDPFPRLMIALFLLNFCGHAGFAFSKKLFDFHFNISYSLNLLGYFIPPLGIAFQSLNEMEKARLELWERKRAEKDLSTEKRKFEAIAENVPVGIAIISRSFETLWSNEFLKGFFDGVRESRIREEGQSAYPAACAAEVLRTGEDLVVQEQTGTDRDGNAVWVQIAASPIRDEDGQITSVMEVIIPISERKRAELRLKTSEDRFSSFMDRATDGLMLLDTDLFVNEANAAMESLLAVQRSDIIGKSVVEVLGGDESDRAEYLKTMETGEPLEREDIMYRTPKGEKSLAIKAFKLNDGLGMVVLDMTARKKVYEELVSARRAAEDANRAKSAFLANISHELRTPMNAIIGIPNMLMKRDTSNLTATQREGLILIFESGKKLLGLIDNILDLSKIEAGMMELYEESFPLDDILSNLEKMALLLIGQKKIAFKVVKEPSAPKYLYSDATKLNQILLNLTGNAVKFTESGSIILRVHAEGKKLFFRIADTGIGIKEEDIEFIFKEYRQAHGTAGKKYQGTGLGLALSRKMIEMMGGKIEMESRINVGTAVAFYIPLQGPERESAGASGEPSEAKKGGERPLPRKAKPKVLIAEDEEIGRVTIRMILGEMYELFFAKNGAEAIEKFQSAGPDIVLMDIMMPEVDGFRAFDIIRSRESGKQVPIIALTARAMQDEKSEIMTHGFSDYVSKPIDDELLVKTIEKHLRGGRE